MPDDADVPAHPSHFGERALVAVLAVRALLEADIYLLEMPEGIRACVERDGRQSLKMRSKILRSKKQKEKRTRVYHPEFTAGCSVCGALNWKHCDMQKHAEWDERWFKLT